jgi:hypothetical protein
MTKNKGWRKRVREAIRAYQSRAQQGKARCDFDSEQADEACQLVFGHSNWSYIDTIDLKDLKKLKKTGKALVFFFDPAEDEEETED